MSARFAVVLGVVVVLAWAVFSVARWPAAHAVSWAESQGAWPQGVHHQGARGQLRKGELLQPGFRGYQAEVLTWRLRPEGLVDGEAVFDLVLRDPEGPLRGRGEGRLELSTGAWTLDADVEVRDAGTADPPLEDALRMLGEPDGGGYRLRLSGRL